MKRMATMPLDAAKKTNKIGGEALQAAVLGNTWCGATCQAVWTVLSTMKISSPCRMDDFF